MSGKRYTAESKLELIRLVEKTGNVAAACKQLGYSRDSYYRILSRFQSGGATALEPQTTRGPLYKNRVDTAIESAIIDLSRCHPTWGQARIAQELEQSGLIVSPGGVRCVWQRNNMETVEKRLQALMNNGVNPQSPQIISHIWPAQPAWLTNQAVDVPGKLGIQDTLLVRSGDYGVKIYMQTFIDAFSRYVLARLYMSNQPDTALDLLNNYVLPNLNGQGVQVQRIATPKLATYVGEVNSHPYEAYLALQEIAHDKLVARSSQEISLLKSFYRYLGEQGFLSHRVGFGSDFTNRGPVANSVTQTNKLGVLQSELEQLVNKYNWQHAVTRYGRYSLSPANVLQVAINATQPIATDPRMLTSPAGSTLTSIVVPGIAGAGPVTSPSVSTSIVTAPLNTPSNNTTPVTVAITAPTLRAA